MLLWALAAAVGATPTPVARIGDPRLAELSGMVESQRRPGFFWAHNDSGNPPELFAVASSGRVVAAVPVDARNDDWEDITIDDSGGLWICDCGNNSNRRDELRLLRVPEPDPLRPPERLVPDRVVRFSYRERQKPRRRGERSHDFDAEALFFAHGRLWLLTKHRTDSRTVLYRFDDLSGQRPVQPVVAGAWDLGPPASGLTMVTAADATPDGRRLAVLTYGRILVFEDPGGESRWLEHPPREFPLAVSVTRQTEALAWRLQGRELWFANEEGALFRQELVLAEPRPAVHRPGNHWPPGFGKPGRDALRRCRDRTQTYATFAAFAAEGLERATLIDLPGIGHSVGLAPDVLERALDWMESGRREVPP